MLTGELRNQIDRIWDAFWSGGISNPLEVIEQITYLLFLRRLDELQTLQELKAERLKKPIERQVFPPGKDSKKRPYKDLRWSIFKNFEPREMYTVVSEHVFPFLKALGADESTYAHHMKDARFTIPTPALLAKVVDLIDHVPMEDRDTKGDLYEYMLGKIATAGQKRPVPHSAPHHSPHGGDGRTRAQGYRLRPSLRNLRLSSRRWRIHSRASCRRVDRTQAAQAFSSRTLPRLRLRQHHAAHRQHEHAAPRHRESGRHLPRFLGARPFWRGREIHLGACQSALRRIARLREHRQGPTAGRQDKKD